MPRPGLGKVEVTCLTCGKTLTRFASQVLDRVYCSRECRFIPIEKRLWSKVDKSGGSNACWPFTGARHPDGYGLLHWKKEGRAHRIAWMVAHGMKPVPKGKVIGHLCNNPPCCNPKHLKATTRADNLHYMYEQGRQADLAGERNHNAILTDAAVLDIMKNYKRGAVAGLAAKYGVKRSTIHSVHNKPRHWKHIKPKISP